MRKLLKEPLVHFLLIGLGLFVLFGLTGWDSRPDSRTIVVDRDALLTFMQYRSKAFNEAAFEQRLDSMPQEQLRLLIDDYVHEETLHREAQALQLDRNDYIIRRRLVQKIEFITKGFADAAADLADAEVRQYFEGNKQDYYVEPHVTFTHVFYDLEKHGEDEAKRLAHRKLAELNVKRVPFSKAPSHGDRFLYHLNYVERVPDYVASHFGTEMARQVLEIKPNREWRGPFQSPYGFHLVLLTAREDGRYPEIEEIYDRVQEDARQARIREKTEKAIEEIIASYDVRVTYKGAEGKEETAAAHQRPTPAKRAGTAD